MAEVRESEDTIYPDDIDPNWLRKLRRRRDEDEGKRAQDRDQPEDGSLDSGSSSA